MRTASRNPYSSSLIQAALFKLTRHPRAPDPSFVGFVSVRHEFPERNAEVHRMLFLAIITTVGPLVSAQHREFLYPDHFLTACGALRRRSWQHRFAAGFEFEPRGPLHLRFFQFQCQIAGRSVCK
jgi:hypothetical protein